MTVGTSTSVVLGILYNYLKIKYCHIDGSRCSLIVQIEYCFILKIKKIFTLKCLLSVIFL